MLRLLKFQSRLSSSSTKTAPPKLFLQSFAALSLSGIALFFIFKNEREKVALAKANSTKNEVGLPLIGGPFSLVDTSGKIVSDKDYLGKYVLLYFGYTFCPDGFLVLI